jgi:hypothetical protein
MGRHYDGWLKAYRDYIVKQESPDIFHLWVGLTMISASLKRNVWIDRGAYKIFPNQYVFLVAETASCRKSVAMETGLDILLTNPKVKAVHERTTVEGLIDLMKKADVTPSEKIRPDGSVLIHADELSNLFGKSHYISDLLMFLTAAFTSKARLDFLTRNRGFAQVRNVCPVLLAGTTPGQFGEIFPLASLATGFLGRVLIITGKRGKRVACPEMNYSMRIPLAEDLVEMSTLEGPMILTPECEKAYVHWYESGEMGEASSVELAPYYERKHDHVLKSAMHLSVSRSNDMVVQEDDFWVAVNLHKQIEAGMAATLEILGATVASEVTDLAVNIIKKNGEPMLHSHLFRRMSKKVSGAKEFGDLIDSLVQMDRIKVITGSRGVFYGIKDKKKKGGSK